MFIALVSLLIGFIAGGVMMVTDYKSKVAKGYIPYIGKDGTLMWKESETGKKGIGYKSMDILRNTPPTPDDCHELHSDWMKFYNFCPECGVNVRADQTKQASELR
ncbi:MAG: hypothetical protein HOP37_09465 [Cyclobacteriaceae bacterium]|nr:hypothetical protein [Cyclobacteriaceae bacterium]